MVLTIEDQSDKTNENDRFIVLQDSREQRNASEATVTLVSVRVVLYMSCQMRSSKSDVNESSATSTVSSRTEQHSQTRRGDRLGAVFLQQPTIPAGGWAGGAGVPVSPVFIRDWGCAK